MQPKGPKFESTLIWSLPQYVILRPNKIHVDLIEESKGIEMSKKGKGKRT